MRNQELSWPHNLASIGSGTRLLGEALMWRLLLLSWLMPGAKIPYGLAIV